MNHFNELVNAIKENDVNAVNLVASMDDLMQLTDDNMSLINVAIKSRNIDIINLLAKNAQCLNTATKNPKEQRNGIRYVAEESHGEPISEREQRLKASFGDVVNMERNALTFACRLADREMIATLLKYKPKTGVADIFGLTEMDYCLQSDDDLLTFYLDECKRLKIQPTLTLSNLETSLGSSDLIHSLIKRTKPNAAAERFYFLLHCAQLDIPRVEELIKDGFKLNKTITKQFNPVLEAATSQLLYHQEMMQTPELIYGLIKSQGAPGTHSIEVNNKDIETLGFDVAYSRAQQKINLKKQQASALSFSEDVLQRIEDRRLSLIELLLKSGLDVELMNQKKVDGFSVLINNTGNSMLVKRLLKAGVDLSIENYQDDFRLTDLGRTTYESLLDEHRTQSPPTSRFAILNSDASWELNGEMVLSAELVERQGHMVVRCTVADIFPIKDLNVAIRNPNSAAKNAWRSMSIIEETVELDDEAMDIEHINIDDLGETVWLKTFELNFQDIEHAENIEFRISTPHVNELSELIIEWQVP